MSYDRYSQGLQCIDCGELMTGIHHYGIRDTCSPCGGRSLVSEEMEREYGT